MAYDKVKHGISCIITGHQAGLVGLMVPDFRGIEFNWAQLHRPPTRSWNALIETTENGSVTVWCSEVERMFRTRLAGSP
jgi:hypothetical protein